MDFRQLAYIIAIAEAGNITRASERLFITRSALDYCLINVEKEIGVPLFRRVHNRMIPTDAGNVYIAHARQVLEVHKSCMAELADLADYKKGSLRFGITPGFGERLFVKIVPLLMKAYPGFDIQLSIGNVKTLYHSLLNGNIDFAWSALLRNVEGLEHIVLEESDIVLAIPESLCKDPWDKDKLCQDHAVNLAHYTGDRFVLMNENSLVRELTDTYFRESQFIPKVLAECDRIMMAYEIVKAGVALGFVPKTLIKKNVGIVYFPFKQKDHFRLAVSFRKRFYLSRVDQYLIKLIKQNYAGVVHRPDSLL